MIAAMGKDSGAAKDTKQLENMSLTIPAMPWWPKPALVFLASSALVANRGGKAMG
jgi:hypothetical protein